MILKNSIRCKKCGDIIESISVHDLVYCRCKAVFIDGGHLYQRVGYESKDLVEDLSICVEDKSDVTMKETTESLIFTHKDIDYIFDKSRNYIDCSYLKQAYNELK